MDDISRYHIHPCSFCRKQEDETSCQEEKQGMLCTRPKGHAGVHVACSIMEHMRLVWPNEEDLQKSPAMEEGGHFFQDPNTGIEEKVYHGEVVHEQETGFDDPGMWPSNSPIAETDRLQVLLSTNESTLRKFIRLMWFQHGALELNEEAFSDGDFDPAEWLTLTNLHDEVIAKEKEKL